MKKFNGINNDSIELFAAIAQNDINAVKTRCTTQNINATANEKGYTPLHCAAFANQIDIASYLLGISGCNINSRCNNKNATPIFLAAIGGHEKMVRFLLNKGAEIDPNLLTNFSSFLEKKYPDILKILRNPETNVQSAHSWFLNSSSDSSTNNLKQRKSTAHNELKVLK